jgi:3'-phosphoadenosine 5'-phosphosulfate (PAPS) 3'-phosphatase
VSFTREREVALEAAQAAGRIIAAHYDAMLTTFEAKDDGSPVSRADLEASAAIDAILGAAFPDDFVLTEERPDDVARLSRERVWIVDPLDGTRDFLQRTGDFCVHVGLAVRGRPTVGVVHHVVSASSAWAVAGEGAYLGDRRLRVSDENQLGRFRVGVSKTSCPPSLRDLFGERAHPSGASVKYLALARGELDAIVTMTPGEKEWDTLAPELVVVESGGKVTDLDGRALAYNQSDLGRRRGVVVSNGNCHHELLALLR